MKTHITIIIGVRQTGQPAASSATLSVQGSQKQAWPHSPNVNPSHGSTEQTSQYSSVAAAAAADEAGADDVGIIADPAVWSSTSSLLLSLCGCKASV